MVIDALLAEILRGDPVDAATLALHDPETLVLAAADHDIVPLVAERLAGRADLPGALQTLLRDRASRAIATDLFREMELKSFLAELDTASIGSLIIKGSHLAYSHYARPDLRPRVDTDVLIQAGAREKVHEILTVRRGYEAISRVFGEVVTAQRLYVRYRDGAIIDAIDIQWKVSNPLALVDVASYEEMLSTSVPLPRLGPGARSPSDVYALLIACAHRADEIHFKWLYDIDVIAPGLSTQQWEEFATLAIDRRLAAVCRRSLERASYWFRTGIPLGLWPGPNASGSPASNSRPFA